MKSTQGGRNPEKKKPMARKKIRINSYKKGNTML